MASWPRVLVSTHSPSGTPSLVVRIYLCAYTMLYRWHGRWRIEDLGPGSGWWDADRTLSLGDGGGRCYVEIPLERLEEFL